MNLVLLSPSSLGNEHLDHLTAVITIQEYFSASSSWQLIKNTIRDLCPFTLAEGTNRSYFEFILKYITAFFHLNYSHLLIDIEVLLSL